MGATGSSGRPGRQPSEPSATHPGLEGEWLVERVSGLLPPGGLRKRIGKRTGSTRVGRLPIAFFRVCVDTLDYRVLPVRDELSPGRDGTWMGRGLLLGREFCRFRLVRASGDDAPV
jgi:hypothetical protein